MDTMGLFRNRFKDNIDKCYNMHYEKSVIEEGATCLGNMSKLGSLKMGHRECSERCVNSKKRVRM